MFFAAEPEPDAGEPSGVGKYASSASSAIGKGMKKARPMLAKLGSLLLTGLRKLAELAMKGLKSAVAAVKGRFSKQLETEEPAPVPAAEEPQLADEEPKDE